MHAGQVRISPAVPYGGADCSMLRASGLLLPENKRIWCPVSAYLIEHPRGLVLVDTAWPRAMSPDGVFDVQAQVQVLGSRLLYRVNQGQVGPDQAVVEQLADKGLAPSDLDYVVLTHLDCDHACGLQDVAGAKKILVSEVELKAATRISSRFRYHRKWWECVNLRTFRWNGDQGPFARSYDLFGDGSIQLVHIPGHAEGQVAVKIRNAEGKFVLLFADGGYSSRSWQKMIQSGIATDRSAQRASLAWIRTQSLDEGCVESLANHDPEVTPHTITL